MKKKILVMFGGCNEEYYASCTSMANLLNEFDRTKYDILTLGITLEGDWILTNASSEELIDGKTWLSRDDNKRAIIPPIKGMQSLMLIENDKIEYIKIDAILPFVPGAGGEDGALPGLFQLADIPYVGAGIAASAGSWDKAVTRLYADYCGLKQPKCKILYKEMFNKCTAKLDYIKPDFAYPVFVKPASQGSSIGILRVDEDNELMAAVENAFKYDEKVLIEEGIIGKELKVAAIGNGTPELGEICEITVGGGVFNSFEMKYKTHSSVKKIPAEISNDLTNEIKRQAIAIFKVLECRGWARIDFFLNDKEEIYFNEINTIPSIGKHSIYSKMLEEVGISIPEVLTRLIESAFN